MTTFDEYLAEHLKDPNFKKENLKKAEAFNLGLKLLIDYRFTFPCPNEKYRG